ncbi:PSD1 and planctomycete cytochrome C domain-containing protein [Rubinisphaera margarita]|uniref:PSD1 and planctomycete cytochrome C domain-containing protein n=1 Tax=Rubinisphaera margarita TaxID=2909586 RepID=UPI001EE7DA80|nr:PSD1 and planctomycete cytochrome C domain-containing protein [Rubinisphaera margarita]MCG6156386.1 PSD1 and planctomycete cytochrome C domain-containing protein [Rubinisphaera margarita]
MLHYYRFLTSVLFFFAVAPTIHATEPISATDLEFFEKRVRPVLIEHCYDCHSAEERSGGLRLDSRHSVLKGGDTGPSIVAGEPEKSLLIEAIEYNNRDLQMPPEQKMSDSQIADLKEWVRRGAPDPRIETPEDSHEPLAGMSIEDGRAFWSFQPVANPSLPAVEHSDWVATPIDHFVLRSLERNDLTPAPKADRETLLRRVTYDLTGLPPTIEELDAFLADTSDDAFDKVVERLLSSPQYGVHWGRHWLDVARYADSNGLDENLAYGHAWRYRDYVINSFNNDKPYDRFVIEQLAGDLLPDATVETRTATGFLSLGAKVLAEPDRNKLDMDIIDEQIDTTGKAFWGLTLGCVRCHDHKFDPVKQSDYYALAAIFKSTQTLAESKTGAIHHWYEHSFATEEDEKKAQEISAEIKKLTSAANAYKNGLVTELRNRTREQAVEYLAAAVLVSPQMSLVDMAKVAEPRGLHPRILHHCRLHLEYHQDDPFFRPWHDLASKGDSSAVRQHYESLFAEMRQATEAAEDKKAPLTEEHLEQARVAVNDNSGFLALPAKPEYVLTEDQIAEYHRLLAVAREFESQAFDEPAAMGVADGEVVPTIPIHIRGSYKNLGQPVAREVPEVMRLSDSRPIFPETGSGRLELAMWATSTEHPLTARVIVNRIWGWHFGQPLVKSTENFGVLGDQPSHPELLDWLAWNFMDRGWSIKELHRMIVHSSAYQMSYHHPEFEKCAAVDQENRLLWRAHLRRLPAESLRDAILSISDRLDPTLGGKTVPLRNRQFVFNHTSEDHTKYDSLRRAVYLPVIRNNLYSLFEQFDFPDPTMPTGHRNVTTIAPQALLLMNSALVLDSAEAFAQRVIESATDPEDRIEFAYRVAYGREPSPEESRYVAAFLNDQSTGAETSPAAELKAWSVVCHGLIAANEFIYLK